MKKISFTKLLKKLEEFINPWKVNRIRIFLTWNQQLIPDWRDINQENMIHIYDVTIIDVAGAE